MSLAYQNPTRTLTALTQNTDISVKINDAAVLLGSGGGVVRIPAGSYLVNTNFVFTTPIVIEGAGRRESEGEAGGTILRRAPGATAPMFQWTNHPTNGDVGRNGGIRHISLDEGYTGQEVPTNAPFLISFLNLFGPAHIENVGIFRCPKGVRIENSGRSTINGLFGDPILIGLEIHRQYDCDMFDHIHFWPYHGNTYGVLRQTSGTAIVIKRADGARFDNVFCLGYNKGVHFAPFPIPDVDQPASTVMGCRSVHIKSLYTDFTMYGVVMDQFDATVLIDFHKSQGAKWIRSGQEPAGLPYQFGWPYLFGTGGGGGIFQVTAGRYERFWLGLVATLCAGGQFRLGDYSAEWLNQANGPSVALHYGATGGGFSVQMAGGHYPRNTPGTLLNATTGYFLSPVATVQTLNSSPN